MLPSQQLRAAFDFTPEDLAANQRGELTENQRSRIRLKLVQNLIGFSVLLILPFIAFVTILQRSMDGADVMMLLCSTLWTGGVAALGWLTIADARSDLRKGKVLSVVGTPELRVRRGYRGARITYWRFDTVEFLVDAGGYDLFKTGQRYQVFYTPATKLIVSVVLLDD
jgi:hypothetical protein